MKRCVLVFTILITFCFWLSAKYSTTVKLEKVVTEGEGSKEVKIENGKSYSDDVIEILWLPAPSGFNFELKNKLKNSISVIWDDCSFITGSGESHRIMHAGIKYINRDQPMPPTQIPMDSKITDLFYPSDYVYFSSGRYGGWSSPQIFDDKMKDKSYEKLANKNPEYRAILVIKNGEQKLIYHFYFKGYITKI